MREWALHIMDLLENSLRAGATRIVVEVSVFKALNLLEVGVQDNGPGLAIPLERAGDPFYTTKPGKTVGLGLSLFRAAVEDMGGVFRAERPENGGLRVSGAVSLLHVDRKPLGDVAQTLWTLAAVNPEQEFILRAAVNGAPRELSWQETRAANGGFDANPLRQARVFEGLISEVLSDVHIMEEENTQFVRNGKE